VRHYTLKHAYRPCLGGGKPTRSVTGYCRRSNTGPCKRGYNSVLWGWFHSVTPRPLTAAVRQDDTPLARATFPSEVA
jgi:hypothetical protein